MCRGVATFFVEAFRGGIRALYEGARVGREVRRVSCDADRYYYERKHNSVETNLFSHNAHETNEEAWGIKKIELAREHSNPTKLKQREKEKRYFETNYRKKRQTNFLSSLPSSYQTTFRRMIQKQIIYNNDLLEFFFFDF